MILNQVRAEKHSTRNTEVHNLNSESMWMPTNLKNVKASFVNPLIKQNKHKKQGINIFIFKGETEVDKQKTKPWANNFYKSSILFKP